MDPLSIATAVVSLTARCLSTCKKLHDLASDYEDVPIIVATICSESTIIGIGLSELQTKILQRDDLAQAWASRTEIWSAFEMALTGCMVVFSCLEAETRNVQSNDIKLWGKIKFMWNQERFKELLTQLRGQQTSITFLLNLLELDTLSSIQKDIRQNARTIQNTAAEAQSLRSRTSSIDMGSQGTLDNDPKRLSVFDVDIISGIAPSDRDFSFDDVVVNSKVYRRELNKAKSKDLKLSALETAVELPEPDTVTVTVALRGNTPDVEVAQTETQQLPVSQSEDTLAETIYSGGVCCTCDESPEQAVILNQQQPYLLHDHQGRNYYLPNTVLGEIY